MLRKTILLLFISSLLTACTGTGEECDASKYDCTPISQSSISDLESSSSSTSSNSNSSLTIESSSSSVSSLALESSSSLVTVSSSSSSSAPSHNLAISSECFFEFTLGESINEQWTQDCKSLNRASFIDPYAPEPIEFYARYLHFVLDEPQDIGFSIFSGSSPAIYLLNGDTGEIITQGSDEIALRAYEPGNYVMEFTGSGPNFFTITSNLIDFGSEDCYEPAALNQIITSSWRPECTSNQRDYIDPYQESNATAHRARFFNFSVGDNGDVDIQIDSDNDHYIYLYEGNDDSSAPIYEGNDSALSLTDGDYTLEVAGYTKDDIGAFTLQIKQLDTNPICEQAATFDQLMSGGWVSSCSKTSGFTNNDPYADFKNAHARYFTFELEEQSDLTLQLITSNNSDAKGLIVYSADDLDQPIEQAIGGLFSSGNLSIDIRLPAGSYTIELLSNTLVEYGLTVDLLEASTTCEQNITLGIAYQGLSDSGCPMVLPVTDNNDPYAPDSSLYVGNRFKFSLLDKQGVSATVSGGLNRNPRALYHDIAGEPPLLIAVEPSEQFSSPAAINLEVGAGNYFLELWVNNNSAPQNFTANILEDTVPACQRYLALDSALLNRLSSQCQARAKSRDFSNFDPYSPVETGFFYSVLYSFAALEAGTYILNISDASFTPEVFWWPHATSHLQANLESESGSSITLELERGYYAIEVTSATSDQLGSMTVTISKPQ